MPTHGEMGRAGGLEAQEVALAAALRGGLALGWHTLGSVSSLGLRDIAAGLHRHGLLNSGSMFKNFFFCARWG